MKKLLLGLLLFPSLAFADRLGSLNRDSDVLLSTQTAGGSGGADDLGNHISTKTITANFGISASSISVSTLTVTSSITARGGFELKSSQGSGFGETTNIVRIVPVNNTQGGDTKIEQFANGAGIDNGIRLQNSNDDGSVYNYFGIPTNVNLEYGNQDETHFIAYDGEAVFFSSGSAASAYATIQATLGVMVATDNVNSIIKAVTMDEESLLLDVSIASGTYVDRLDVGHTSVHRSTSAFYGAIDVSSGAFFDSRFSVYQSSGITIPRYTLQDLVSPTVSPGKIGALSEYRSVESNNAVTGGVGISGVSYVPRLDRIYMADNNALGIHVLRAGDLSVRIASITLSGFNDPEAAEFMDYRYNDAGELVGLIFVVSEEQLNQLVIFEVSPSTQPQVITKAGSLTLRPTNLWTPDATEGMESVTWNPHKRVFYVAKQNDTFEFFVVPYDGTFNPAATEPFDAEAKWGATMPAINDLSYDLATRTCYAIGDLISSSTNDQDILHFDCETGDIIEHWNNYIDDAGLTTGAGWVQSEGIAVYHGTIWVSSEGNEVARLEKGGSGSSPWTEGTGVMQQTTANTRPEARYSTDGTVVGLSLIQDLGAVDMDGNEILCLDFERYDNNELESSQSVAHRGRICSETPTGATAVPQESGGQIAIHTTLGSGTHGSNTNVTNMRLFNTGQTTVYGHLKADQRFVLGASSYTIADSGDGSAATGVITSTESVAKVNCLDTDGCSVTFSETGIFDLQTLKIVNISANNVTLPDTAGQQETNGPILGQYEATEFLYVNDRWIQITQ